MTEKKTELNPEKIKAVVAFVAKNPGCTKKAASEAAAKQASYGYRFVQAAIEQGFVSAQRQDNVRGRPYILYVTPLASQGPAKNV